MAERYKTLYSLPKNLHLTNFPLIIVAGALLKDTKTENLLVHLKLKNLSEKHLIACKVAVRLFDITSKEIDNIQYYSYLDLDIARGKDFGVNNPFFIHNNTVRKIIVSVIETVYADGEILYSNNGEWLPISIKQELISEKFSDIELQKQYHIEVGGNSNIVPHISDDLFFCTCGAINLSGDYVCYNCERNIFNILSALNLETLTSKKNERLACEEKERLDLQRREEEICIAKENRNKIIKKIIFIIVIILIICCVAAFVYYKIIIPNSKYNEAISLKNNGQYDEAIVMFEEIEDYKNSFDLILECKYSLAELALETGDFDTAFNGFTSLGTYNDAAQRVKEIPMRAYNMGLKNIESKDYEDALRCFTYAGDNYLNSEDYRCYCEIKQINFDDSEVYDLGSLTESVLEIKDNKLRAELIDIPQIQTVLRLDGMWKSDNTFIRKGDNPYYKYIEVRNGKSTFYLGIGDDFPSYIYYQSGVYYYDTQFASGWYKIENITDNSFVAIRYNDSITKFHKVS